MNERPVYPSSVRTPPLDDEATARLNSLLRLAAALESAGSGAQSAGLVARACSLLDNLPVSLLPSSSSSSQRDLLSLRSASHLRLASLLLRSGGGAGGAASAFPEFRLAAELAERARDEGAWRAAMEEWVAACGAGGGGAAGDAAWRTEKERAERWLSNGMGHRRQRRKDRKRKEKVAPADEAAA